MSNSVRILIHDPSVYPTYATIEKVLQVKSETIIRIYATRTECSDQVHRLPQSARNCLFRNERKLRLILILNHRVKFDRYMLTFISTDISVNTRTSIVTQTVYSHKYFMCAIVCHFKWCFHQMILQFVMLHRFNVWLTIFVSKRSACVCRVSHFGLVTYLKGYRR